MLSLLCTITRVVQRFLELLRRSRVFPFPCLAKLCCNLLSVHFKLDQDSLNLVHEFNKSFPDESNCSSSDQITSLETAIPKTHEKTELTCWMKHFDRGHNGGNGASILPKNTLYFDASQTVESRRGMLRHPGNLGGDFTVIMQTLVIHR